METSAVFKLNSPHVVCEILEGDAVLVHFESGLYYSVRSIGAEICGWMMKGHSIRMIVQVMTAQYGLQSQIEEEVSTFVEGLVAARLFVLADVPSHGETREAPSFRATGYEKPVLEMFDDMADQLLLDKIEDETREAWIDPG